MNNVLHQDEIVGSTPTNLAGKRIQETNSCQSKKRVLRGKIGTEQASVRGGQWYARNGRAWHKRVALWQWCLRVCCERKAREGNRPRGVACLSEWCHVPCVSGKARSVLKKLQRASAGARPSGTSHWGRVCSPAQIPSLRGVCTRRSPFTKRRAAATVFFFDRS